MDVLEEVGYLIDKQGSLPPRFFSYEDERLQQAEFTEEEAQLLQQALAGVLDNNPLLPALRQKIDQHATLMPLADGLIDLHQSRIVALLAGAIRDRRQVRLLRYQSVNGNTISDRLVEPHSFADDFSQLTAYEPGTLTHKTQRIEAVDVLDIPQTQPPTDVPTDAFDWPGDLKTVSLKLTYQAYRLLTEEYPSTKPDTKPTPTDPDFPYQYTGQVRSWIGVGRFYLGLPGQVRITSPDAFRQYIQGRIGEFKTI